MKLGDSGKAVKGLQGKLVKLGYTLKVDGAFGAKTDEAVRDFQTKHGLAVDGDVGSKTLDAIDAALAVNTAASVPAPPTAFDAEGWYRDARRIDAHPQRMGGTITPKGATVHTTDCMPGTMPGILRRMHTERADGGGAHFWIGRQHATLDDALNAYPSGGVVQTVPITRNGNHAGGPNGVHGWVRLANGGKLHPNSVYVGIEIDCAGKLQSTGSKFLHRDSGKFIDAADVFIDERGKPWHRVTDYQFEQLDKLLAALDAACAYLPADAKLQPNGSYQLNGVTWAALPGTRFVTHVALDPIRKTDPGPQVTTWLRERYGR